MDKKTLLRCAAWLLAVCAVMPMAMSCGDDSEKKPTGTTASKKETETIDENDPYADRLAISDDLGEYDFNKYEYRIVYTDRVDNMYDVSMRYVVDGESADIVETALYQRNRAIEERFNCRIRLVEGCDPFSMEPFDFINRQVTSGDDMFDLAATQVIYTGMLVPEQLFLNWYDIPNINFDKPWWSDSNKELLTYNDVCFAAIGDVSLNAMAATYCVFYNKRLGADYDMPDMFEIVNDGAWTIDKITELSKDIYVDMNMDGKVDLQSDLFGYVSDSGSNLNAYLWSFDNPIFSKENDELACVYETDKLDSLVAKLCDTFNIYRGIQQCGYSGSYVPWTFFSEGRALFMNSYISIALAYLRDMQDDYSILPYPKWDEEQEEYYSMVDGLHHALFVPTTVANLEAVGTITEALCAETYKKVFPVYYDTALKIKGTRDEESIKMLDSIVASRVFDFGYIYDGFKGFSFILQNQVGRNNKNIASSVKRLRNSAFNWYDKILEAFENYEG